MRQPIRAFSIGLLTASVILLVVFLFFKDNSVTEQQYTMDELKNKVEEKGYRIVSEEEYITLSLMEEEELENDNNSEKTETKSDNKADKTNKTEEGENKEESVSEESKSYTLKVEPNMMPHIVSDLLEKNKIIENASELDQYLEEHDISNLIQIGDHQLNSDMTIAEIAEEITK
ncbi:hypothetical protein ACLIBG_06575 [Virgibacillus sp. W0181]|uniref:hypothetical protein n=1 Tax=Virgibacillus sp. W0181 TaxID=3391581 RepID=UPI003F450398